MSGLYVHIPFCKSRCIYCAFYSTILTQEMAAYVDSLCKEISLRRQDWTTVYIGGGTPSRLSPDLLRKLFGNIDCGKAKEITIECNPDDVSSDFASLLASLPVNRVSLGIQTFSDSRLRFLRRRHNSSQAIRAVERLRKAGIDNISIDLMYGFPDETSADWLSDIDVALSLSPNHISAYMLTLEENTPLYNMKKEGKLKECDEELAREMYYTLIDRLCSSGYDHYEISNFALPGFRSVHNSGYWKGEPYVGVGAAAHSYLISDGQESRQWNIGDVRRYIESMSEGKRLFGSEILTDNEIFNDMIMLSLRTREGIDLKKISDKWGDNRLEYIKENAKKYVDSGLLLLSPSRLSLSREGLFVSDMITSSLMIAD